MNNGRQEAGKSVVYLLRHGDSRQDAVRRYIGQSDDPLNETGRIQAERWQRELRAIPLRRFFCSDLRRSVETARIILGDRAGQVTVLPGMREISMGRWEGLPMEEVRCTLPEEYERRGARPDCHRPPGGENFIDLRERVLPLFETILRDESGPALLVGHAGVNRVILCHLLGMPLDNLFRLRQDYGCMNIIVREKGSLRVDAMNLRPWIGFSAGDERNLK